MLLVIGQSTRPRAFKKVGVNSLPVDWKTNKKSWMISQMMAELLESKNKIPEGKNTFI